jgi:peptide/nickel transport system substrate-binding protein
MPGSDGVLQRLGQRFTFSVASQGRSYFPKEAEAIAGQISEVGIPTSPLTFASNASNLNELTATFPGALTWPSSFGPTWAEALTTWRIPSVETRWTGANFGGYSNPALDQLYERYQVTLPANDRTGLMADVMKVIAEDVAVIPLYHMMQTVMFRKGIRGPGKIPAIGNQLASAWNIHTWEMD